jgi:hypothetical protein
MLNKFIKYKVREFLAKEDEKEFLGEGLIMTHPIEQVVSFINKYMANKYAVRVNYNGNFIIIHFRESHDKVNPETLLKTMNNFGYFPASYIFNGRLVNIDSIDVKKCDGIRFEAKYDMKSVDIGEYLYHVTDRQYLDKILRIGLTPKTKSKVSYHPERIYLAKNIKSAKLIMELFFDGGFVEDPVMLRINTQGLNNVFMIDNQFIGDAVYTHHNIPPSNISAVPPGSSF